MIKSQPAEKHSDSIWMCQWLHVLNGVRNLRNYFAVLLLLSPNSSTDSNIFTFICNWHIVSCGLDVNAWKEKSTNLQVFDLYYYLQAGTCTFVAALNLLWGVNNYICVHSFFSNFMSAYKLEVTRCDNFYLKWLL